jgi:hypothetical protein
VWIVSLNDPEMSAVVLFDPKTGAYIGPKCPGYHPRPYCIDPRCQVKSDDHSSAVRRSCAPRWPQAAKPSGTTGCG